MGSPVKFGIAALVVLAVVAGSLGTSVAGVTCFASCSIRIDDLSETPTLHVFANPPIGAPVDVTAQIGAVTTGELITFTLFLQNPTVGARYADLFEDSVGGTLSDRLLVVVALPPPGSNFSQVNFTFGSDVTVPLPLGATQVDALVENGTAQNLTNLAASLGPMISSIQVASDVEAVPEPATLLLVGGPFAGLVAAAWKRSRRRVARA